MVAPANATGNPRAMMVHSQDADTTAAAVMGTLWSFMTALFAPRGLARQWFQPALEILIVGIDFFTFAAPLIFRVGASPHRCPSLPLGRFRSTRVSERSLQVTPNRQDQQKVEHASRDEGRTRNGMVGVPLSQVDGQHNRDTKI